MSEPPALLRLGLAPGSLSRLRQNPLFGERRGRVVKAALRLLDTPDRRFAANGWLCLGLEDRAGLRHLRLPVSGDAAAPPPAISDSALQTLATGMLEGRAVTLDRDGQTLLLQGHRVTLDRGSQQVAYDALVLEGAADSARPALHALAADLGRDLPLRWTGAAPLVQAAVELGLILPPPQRAAAFESGIAEDLDAMAAFAAIARQCLAQFDANLAPVLLDRDIEGVHQMRVALRRLRSAVGLYADLLDTTRLAPLLDDLRWLNGPLGRKRDLDVFMAETLTPLRALPDPPRGLQHLATVLDDRRVAAQQALHSALTAPRVAHFRLQFELLLDAALDGSAVTEAATAALPAPQFAASLLRQRRRKLRKLGTEHESLDTEALHELRIRAKKLRYAAEFFRAAFSRRESRRFIAALAELQDCLGALNDADVGSRLTENILSGPDRDPAAAAIAAWFAGRQQLQLAHLGAAWRAFDRIKPFWKDALEH